MAEEGEKGGLIQKLIDIVNEISAISDYRCTVKKLFSNLVRRLKLLTPLFEEIRDIKEPIPDDSHQVLVSLMEAMESAKELLQIGKEGSKLMGHMMKSTMMRAKSFLRNLSRDKDEVDGSSIFM